MSTTESERTPDAMEPTMSDPQQATGTPPPSPTPPPAPLPEDWCVNHFDHLDQELANRLPETMERMRSACPVARSDQYGGFYTVTRYDDVVDVARNWEVFTSTRGLAVVDGAGAKQSLRNLPVQADPPEQRIYKNLTNPFFTPSVTAAWEEPTRALVNRFIDEFIERGECDFMESLARPFPSQAFFLLALNAPIEDVEKVAELASTSSTPTHPRSGESWAGLHAWIRDFVASRREQEPKGDVVDAIIAAEVDGRPISDDEIYGTVQLLILGGLETTAGALGQMFLRFCRQPEIPALLRARPELMPKAVQELLRLDGSFVSVGRTVTQDVEIGGHQLHEGDKMLIHWGSANRDEDVFPDPHEFRLDREHNRHVAFGMGVHRCTGSNLARFNIKIVLEECLRRMQDIRLAEGAEINFHAGLTRTVLKLPLTFTPGPREGSQA
jgi:cytochrome P450